MCPLFFLNMKYYTSIILFFLITSCTSSDSPDYYFKPVDRDVLITNMITYIGPNAPYASDSTRFNPEFKASYVKQLPQYQLVNLFKTEGGIYYYFLIRPVGHLAQFRRGVVGSFTLDSESLMPKNFKEIINTPHLAEAVVKERAGFLFKELVKKGNIQEYMVMRDYVEWPDSTLKYSDKTNRWVFQR